MKNGEEILCIMRTPEEKEKEKGTKSIFETIMTKNFPNLGREEDIQMHDAQKTPYALNMNKAMPRHNLIVKSQRQKF